MSITKKQLYVDLYQEHLVEIGMLLFQSKNYFTSADILWIDEIELERRLDGHVDALTLGYKLALQTAFTLLVSDDEDEVLGAIYFLATIDSVSIESEIPLNKIIEYFVEEQDEERLVYFVMAFRMARHVGLSERLLCFLKHKEILIRIAIVEILGYRADADPHRICALFYDKDEAVKTAAMIAVMRLGFKKSAPAMEQIVLENKGKFNEHRVFPLLMLGSKKALQFSRLACLSEVYTKPQYPIYLALAGDENDVSHVIKMLKFDGMNLSVIEALGIFGSLKGVGTLMRFLSSEDDDEKLAAAIALNEISGAQLFEIISVVENDDDDIEIKNITGKPGADKEAKKSEEKTVNKKQDCTDKGIWVQWWQENKSRFDTAIRYRKGKPFSFLLCLEEITHPETTIKKRQRAYNELVIRSGHHIPFEPDWFIDKQIDSLKNWQSWWNKNKSTFSNQWMFNGS